MEEAVPGFMQEEGLCLLLFGGKGGVGMTTCAAAAALYLARKHPARPFLLVSTDPAHSLLDCLAGDPAPENLTLREIDPQESLLRFKARNDEHLRTIAPRGGAVAGSVRSGVRRSARGAGISTERTPRARPLRALGRALYVASGSLDVSKTKRRMQWKLAEIL